MTPDLHERFRNGLAMSLAELLAADEHAWMARHEFECEPCRTLAERVRGGVATGPDGEGHQGHAPGAMLAAWLREPASFTPLERELLLRHLRACETCPAELVEMAAYAGLPTPLVPPAVPAPRRYLPGIAGLLAAATLVAVFFSRTHEPSVPMLPPPATTDHARPGTGPGAGTPPGTSQAVPASVRVVFPERVRGTVAGLDVIVHAAPTVERLLLRLPVMFLPGSTGVRLTLSRAGEDLPQFTRIVPASALARDLELVSPGGWPAGDYELRVVPGSGADVAETREFRFRIIRDAR